MSQTFCADSLVPLLLCCGLVACAGEVPPPRELLTSILSDSRPQPRWAAPRRSAQLALRSLWRHDSENGKLEFLYPAEVQFSSSGLLVFDYGEKHIKVLNAANGSLRRVAGRKGSGPGEFNGPITLFGTWSRPMAVEFSVGRVTSLSEPSLIPVSVARSGRWATGCAWGEDQILFQAFRHNKYDNFVSTVGENARIVDSVALPWPRLLALPFIARQAGLRQLDDTTCAVLPLYHQEFGVLTTSGVATLGMHIEELPPAVGKVEASGNSRISSIARGAKRGGIDARAWRDAIVVLFVGVTPLRGRILDVFSRANLRYRGSIELPFEASRIAIKATPLSQWGRMTQTRSSRHSSWSACADVYLASASVDEPRGLISPAR